MKDYLSITQMAKLRNVTTETLRHYDRIGLLKPDYVDKFTGYRYYSMEQVELFDTIIDLKNLGLPLKDISEYMRSRNFANTYALLTSKEAELKKEIEQSQKQLEQIQEKIQYLDKIRDIDFSLEENWKLQAREKRVVVVSKEKEKSITDFFYEFTMLRKNLKSEYTVFGTNISGSVILLDSFSEKETKRFSRYPAIDRVLCQKELLYGEEMEIPEGQYLCCMGRGLFKVGNPIVSQIMDYLERHNLRLAGDIYERDILDLSLTNDENEVVFYIEIPVIPL